MVEMLRPAGDGPPAPSRLYTRRVSRTAAIVTLAFAMAGCGLKGDLYLPPAPVPAAVPAEAAAEGESGGAPAEGAGDGSPRRQLPAPPDRSESQ